MLGTWLDGRGGLPRVRGRERGGVQASARELRLAVSRGEGRGRGSSGCAKGESQTTLRSRSAAPEGGGRCRRDGVYAQSGKEGEGGVENFLRSLKKKGVRKG